MRRFRNNLIVLEGIDGSGKHTQAVLLAERLRRESGLDVTERSGCPGTTPVRTRRRCCMP